MLSNNLTSLERKAFNECISLTTLTIPASVTSIGKHAFLYCHLLTEVSLSPGLISIGDSAFAACSNLASISIPDTVTSIGRFAFSSCSQLTTISIPDSVVSIGGHAFAYCPELTHASLGSGLTTLENSPFYGCPKLMAIEVSPSNEHFLSLGGVLFSITMESLIFHPPGKPGSTYAIPNGVTLIKDFAFQSHDNLTSLTIPDSVTLIERRAFYYCPNLSMILFDGPPPADVGDAVFSNVSPTATVKVWPEHAESFGGVEALWNELAVRLRDTSPKISFLSIDSTKTHLSISGGPNQSYLLNHSTDLINYTPVATTPAIIATDSSGTLSVSIDTPSAKGFFILKEVPE